jgi:hypothetical protein
MRAIFHDREDYIEFCVLEYNIVYSVFRVIEFFVLTALKISNLA